MARSTVSTSERNRAKSSPGHATGVLQEAAPEPSPQLAKRWRIFGALFARGHIHGMLRLARPRGNHARGNPLRIGLSAGRCNAVGE